MTPVAASSDRHGAGRLGEQRRQPASEPHRDFWRRPASIGGAVQLDPVEGVTSSGPRGRDRDESMTHPCLPSRVRVMPPHHRRSCIDAVAPTVRRAAPCWRCGTSP